MAAPNFADDCKNLTLTLLRLRISLLKLRCEINFKQYLAPGAKFRADQPRVPAGDPNGGQ
jgi:hypothetical protein